ncbi:acyltransferase [Mesorhizobium sp. WSM4307]|uniref:acyltransferase family protein n=1 Tax=unclassified Mesorhizobium TaxID=325217 RepID=UPI000BB04D44|nr:MULTISPECIES: acyltransferase [unclassified Mesorhizobium]PBB26131.1 acyltransferase [Mesorhizobium sp. WSM4304]PBB75782.1 acyltransferase [Mesorhizobium sp. WSM4308]PBC21546.1 acyltransferase [Mesorhizobium sp. WSM4311]TRC81962.1 acyltransferase [Mesorhizobium sp. WSM4315]TRC82930.1 acyltransferase [Mesorhizobium sp. WSM4307]
MIGLYDIWPAFVVVALLWPLAGMPLFQRVGFESNSSRVRAIDGMRGYLALAVVLHHAVIYHEMLATGAWKYPPSAFYGPLGQVGVSLFFIISAYLFWGKLLSAKSSVDFPTLFLKRAFRIGPLYVLAVGTAMALEVADGAIDYSAFATYERAFFNLLFGVFGYVPLSSSRVCVLACVTWTLPYEWLLYFSLPIAAIFSRHPVARMGLPAFLLAFSILMSVNGGRPAYGFLGLFAGGMLCATLEAQGLLVKWHRHALSAAALVMLVCIFAVYKTAYAPGPMLLCIATFFLVVTGADFFGLLTASRSVRLGEISFGIYLLQGLAFVSTFSIAPLRAFAMDNAAQYWLVILIAMVLLVLMALVAHLVIEKPGVSLGNRLAAVLRLSTQREVRETTAADAAQPWRTADVSQDSLQAAHNAQER